MKRYSAAEIAAMNLPGLPTTKAKILARAEKEEWHYEIKIGLGGRRKMFVVPQCYLPTDGVASGQTVTEAAHSRYVSSDPEKGTATPVGGSGGKVVGAVIAGSSQGDMDRIQLVIRAVSEWEEERGIKIDEARRPAVIAVLYDYVKKAEEAGEGTAGIDRFLKALG